MNKFKLIVISFMTILLGGTVLVGTSIQDNKQPDGVLAATNTSGFIFTTQKANNSNPYCYVWGNSNNNGWPGVKMQEFTWNGTTYYGISTSGVTNPTNCIFNSGSNAWQTGNLTLNSSNNVCTSYSKSSSSCTWSSLPSPDVFVTENVASEETVRVFMTNISESLYDWNSAGASTGVRVWPSSTSSKTLSLPYKSGFKSFTLSYSADIYRLKWFEDNNSGPTDNDDPNNKWYGYADIPVDSEGFQAVRLHPKEDTLWNYGATNITDFTNGSLAKVLYLYHESGNAYENVEISTGYSLSEYGVGSELMEKVFESYYSCSSSNINGAGAYKNIHDNFYQYLDDDAKDTLITCEDGQSYTLRQKMAQLYETAGVSAPVLLNNSLFFGTDNEYFKYFTLIMIVITLLTTALIFKKFKKQRSR